VQLPPRELQLWKVELDAATLADDHLAEMLSADERRRWQRFLREADRRRFLVSHAALRTILGKYLGTPPDRVEITSATGGKPQLPPPSNGLPLRFNLSHSEGLAMVALALGQEVGVDVEHVHPFADMGDIVERYFAPAERAAWQALPAEEQCAAFFRCWTRKEAYLKAQGIGLSGGLDRFEVSMAPAGEGRRGQSPSVPRPCEHGARLRAVAANGYSPLLPIELRDVPELVERWTLYDVSPGGEYCAACAVEGAIENGCKISDFKFEI
jgi:4'-phosphopantetheinyl transferase